MNLTALLVLNISVTLVIMSLLWILSLLIKNASIVDIYWGIGFVLIAWITYFNSESHSSRAVLINVLTSIWGMRLAIYLAMRNFGKGEDYRYRAMRDHVGPIFPFLSLFIVFLLQGVIIWFVAFPLQITQFSKVPLNVIDLVGLILWTVGFFFEAVGDWQLARFKANPENRGQVLTSGLWKYTRHPNYFGDFLIWWGFYTISVAAGAWWTIFSPVIMSILLIRISGVALLERSLKEKRLGYQQYVSSTSAFFPLPPRRSNIDITSLD